MEDIYFYGFSAAYVFVIFLGLMVLKPKASDEDFFLTRRWMLILISANTYVHHGIQDIAWATVVWVVKQLRWLIEVQKLITF